jgi:uncharacterized protein (DUF2141 family)
MKMYMWRCLLGASIGALLTSTVIAAGEASDTPGGRCRTNEAGPALRVEVGGLKDRTGMVRLELYPDRSEDFLADEARLVRAGKVFRRVLEPVPGNGQMELCIRAPSAGNFALLVVHERSGTSDFNNLRDGIGVPANPKSLGGAPQLAQATVRIGSGVARVKVVMMYRKSLLSFGPI